MQIGLRGRLGPRRRAVKDAGTTTTVMVQKLPHQGARQVMSPARPRSGVAAIVYAETPALMRAIVSRLDPSQTEVVGNRGAFAARLHAVGQGVMALGAVSSDFAAWAGRTARPGTHLVVVSRLTPENARRLGPLQSDGIRVLWLEELSETIRLPVIGAPPDPLYAFAERVASRPEVCPMVGRALRLICCSEVPPHSVRSLSARLGVAPTTFRYHWQVGLRHGLPPKELVQWATLVRAIELRGRAKWVSVAYRLGVHRRTLERLSHRLTGCSLGNLAADPTAAAGLFRRRAEDALP
jgi:hypothetical protein